MSDTDTKKKGPRMTVKEDIALGQYSNFVILL